MTISEFREGTVGISTMVPLSAIAPVIFEDPVVREVASKRKGKA